MYKSKLIALAVLLIAFGAGVFLWTHSGPPGPPTLPGDFQLPDFAPHEGPDSGPKDEVDFFYRLVIAADGSVTSKLWGNWGEMWSSFVEVHADARSPARVLATEIGSIGYEGWLLVHGKHGTLDVVYEANLSQRGIVKLELDVILERLADGRYSARAMLSDSARWRSAAPGEDTRTLLYGVPPAGLSEVLVASIGEMEGRTFDRATLSWSEPPDATAETMLAHLASVLEDLKARRWEYRSIWFGIDPRVPNPEQPFGVSVWDFGPHGPWGRGSTMGRGWHAPAADGVDSDAN